MGIGFLVVGIGIFATAGTFDTGTTENPNTSLGETLWGWLLFANFFGGVIAAIMANKKWLLWKAYADDTKWYAKTGANSAANQPAAIRGFNPEAVANVFSNSTLVPTSTTQTPSSTSNQHLASTDTFQGSVDINSATAHDLVVALGIDKEIANRILSIRSNLGSFTSFDQLMSRTQVPPHLLLPHRNKLAFGEVQTSDLPSSQQSPTKGNSRTRRLDI